MSPESQDIVVIIPQPNGLIFGEPDPLTQTHRFTGSYMPYSQPLYQGGRARMEISDPSVCHRCGAAQHFFSRIAGSSSLGFTYEAGWSELNDFGNPDETRCRDTNKQFALTVLSRPDPNAPQDIMCHRRFRLHSGSFHTFRVRQCANPGVFRVCGELWDENQVRWRLLRSWPNVMRCQNGDGSGNCGFEFLHEAATTPEPFFALNGGPDGLKMRDVRIRTDPRQWPLFTTERRGAWWPPPYTPYSMCFDAAVYRFRSFFGLPDCSGT
jgi:hypothetical protein